MPLLYINKRVVNLSRAKEILTKRCNMSAADKRSFCVKARAPLQEVAALCYVWMDRVVQESGMASSRKVEAGAATFGQREK